MTEKLDVYSRVTDKIIADLEAGNLHMVAAVAGRRTQGGSVSQVRLRAGGIPYRGVNVLMLWACRNREGL